MSRDPDRLSALLPRHIQRRDAETGGALRALLAVVGEQADIVQDGIEQLYDDWFIETCADWVVPYLGELVGYRMPRGYTEALAGGGEAARLLAARLAPRRDVADTVADRRRKGTLSLLENIAASVADWPARAVEFRTTLAVTQPVRLFGDADAARRRTLATPGRFVDVRQGAALDLLDSPFDQISHVAEAPRISVPGGTGRQGRHAPQDVGLFVWRLRPRSVTHAPAYCVDRARNLYTFSILGNDTQLVTKPLPEPVPTHIAGVENVPAGIRRRAAQDGLVEFYGPGKSFTIWRDDRRDPIPPSAVVIADLSQWRYRPRRHQVAVDPVLGRLAFGAWHVPRRGVWVTYHHAAPDDLGGGEYPRLSVTPGPEPVYRVGPGQEFERINDAYEQWRRDAAGGGTPEAVIEITHSGAYQEQIEFAVGAGQRLTVRAADGTRPVLRLLDWYSNRPDALQIRGTHHHHDDGVPPGQVVLDGLLITGRGVSVTGPVASVTIRHCTLVPGWSLEPHCAPAHPQEPSLVLEDTTACVQIEHSILGTILVVADEVHTDPLPIHIADSILDATAPDREALSAPECRHAHAVLHVRRSTVIGEVFTHAVSIAENSVFDGRLHVARRGEGCLRFCYVPAGSRTPRRYHCEPDSVQAALRDRVARGDLDPADLPALRILEAARVRPRFTDVHYGTPGYGQLSAACADEIRRGAEDGSEMGAFHHLFQPQREDNLRARLSEFVPAGCDAGIIFVT
jgi:hypothetical protein